MSYSPALTMGVWLGNPDTTILKKGTSSLGSPIIASVMEYAHKEVYAPEGKWKSGDWFTQPAGIQRIGKEVYPSWWSKSQGQTNFKLTFDRLSKKKATDCTPEGAKLVADVLKTTDPVTKKDSYANAPDGYNSNEDDDAHVCGEATPYVSNVTTGPNVTFNVTPGKFPLDVSGINVTVNGTPCTGIAKLAGYTYKATCSPTGQVTVTATDNGYYSHSASS